MTIENSNEKKPITIDTAVSEVFENLSKHLRELLEFSRDVSNEERNKNALEQGSIEMQKALNKTRDIITNTLQDISSTLEYQWTIYLTKEEHDIRKKTIQHEVFQKKLKNAENEQEIQQLINRVLPLDEGVFLFNKTPDANNNFQVTWENPDDPREYKQGILWQNGERIVDLSSHQINTSFKGTTALLYGIQDTKTNREWIVDERGEQLFSSYFSRVREGNIPYTLNIYQDASHSEDGIHQRGVAHIDTKSRILPLGKYKDAISGSEQFQENGNYRVQRVEDREWIIVNPHGKEIIHASDYQKAPNAIFWKFDGKNILQDIHGNYPLYKSGKWGLLGKKGDELIPFEYEKFDMAGTDFEIYQFTLPSGESEFFDEKWININD